MSRVLFVLTTADSIELTDGTKHPTGFWAEEFVVSHREIVKAGHDVVIATPGGRLAPVDPGSLSADAIGAVKATELAAYLEAVREVLASPEKLEEIDAGDFDAVVMPGGHGPMVDLVSDASLAAILRAADSAGTIIAPFCHGPAGLLSATKDDGAFLFAGRRLATFTDEEELNGGVGDKMPWLLETRLTERGAEVDAAAAWSSHVVVDGNLISGQNPQSSEAVAEKVLEALAR